jgi:hypothetical protein
MDRTEAAALWEASKTLGSNMTLTTPQGSFTVEWRHDGDNPAVDLRPIHLVADPDSTTIYDVAIRLVNVI